MPKLISTIEVAERAGVQPNTVRQARLQGKIVAHSQDRKLAPDKGGVAPWAYEEVEVNRWLEMRAQSVTNKGPRPVGELAQVERDRYEDRIRTLTANLRGRTKEDLTADFIGRYYFAATAQDLEIPDWTLNAQGMSTSAPGVPVTNWSDWHFGELVDPAQVEGANEFNVEIADRRIQTLVERVIDLSTNHMTAPDYPGIVVNLGGDMISGNIHDELKQTNEMESIPAVLHLAGKLVWAFERLLEHFPAIFIPTTPGNHGRNTHRPQAKNTCVTSFDWMLYKILEMHYADNPRISFFIPDGFDAYYRVFGHRILLTHGDRLGARGGDGFIGVIGPIMRGAHKLRLSYIARGRDYDTLMMGHWHNEITHPGLRVNDCLKGYDEWAMSMRFTPHPPAQDLFFIHPMRGITCSWPIQLETPRHGEDAPDWAAPWKEMKDGNT